VNAGTVFYLGYDDRFREASQIEDDLYPSDELKRTNRAFFGKLQVLFRY
jgi:hypothetical protein